MNLTHVAWVDFFVSRIDACLLKISVTHRVLVSHARVGVGGPVDGGGGDHRGQSFGLFTPFLSRVVEEDLVTHGHLLETVFGFVVADAVPRANEGVPLGGAFLAQKVGQAVDLGFCLRGVAGREDEASRKWMRIVNLFPPHTPFSAKMQ
jgi:hypothetical protein